MGLFGKDYSRDFEILKREISKQSDKSLVKQQEIEESLERLEKGFSELSSHVKDIQTMLVNLTDSMENVAHVTMNFGVEESEEPKEESNRIKKGSPIYAHKRYPQFKVPRQYDMEIAKFYSIGGNGAKRYFDLNFRQLVSIIKGCQNGLNIKELMINPILKDFTYANLLNYSYIWRAGGFNNAINEVARELGFNPKKLVSHECD